ENIKKACWPTAGFLNIFSNYPFLSDRCQELLGQCCHITGGGNTFPGIIGMNQVGHNNIGTVKNRAAGFLYTHTTGG
ncbi:MAG: hypothetical protein KAS84_00670, partial [Anaerolineales bacterium]|nr:hypothetical protein [Anaerolineales bacterium]